AHIGTASDVGGGIIGVFSPESKRLVSIGGGKEGGLVRVNGHDEKERGMLWCTASGKSGLGTLFAGNTKPTVPLGSGPLGGFLTLNALDGKNRTGLGVNKEGGYGIFFGKDAKTRLYLGANLLTGHGMVNVLGNDSQPRVVIGVDQNGIGSVEGR